MMWYALQMVLDKISEVQVSERHGIRMVGLYGVSGIGKTTMCQVLCNKYLKEMEGRVFHAELGSASNMELLQGALKSLTEMSESYIDRLNTMKV